MASKRTVLTTSVIAGVPFVLAFIAVWWFLRAPQRFAERFVDLARTEAGIPASMVDGEVIERIRRLESARGLAGDGAMHDHILSALRGETGPDGKLPADERMKRQRERASRGLAKVLQGRCKAWAWPTGASAWVDRLTEAVDGAPVEVTREQDAVRALLAGSEGAKVVCEKGEVGLLILRGPMGARRVVDIFPTRTRMPLVMPAPDGGTSGVLDGGEAAPAAPR